MISALLLAGCNTTGASKLNAKLAMAEETPPVETTQADADGHYKIGKPYKVAGTWYTPAEDPDYDEVGRASWYGSGFHGRRTANGEIFDMASLSAAHPTLPLPSYARVTNLDNGRSVVVRLNDRGPYAHNRLIDVSERTAEVLGFKQDGSADVRVQFVGLAPSDGDDSWLTTTVRQDGLPVSPTMVASADAPADQSQTDQGQADQVRTASASAPAGTSAAAGGEGGTSLAWTERAKPAPQLPATSFGWTSGYRESANPDAVEAAFALFDR